MAHPDSNQLPTSYSWAIVAATLAAGLVAGVAGCGGGYNVGELVPVTGVVKLNGKPTPGVAVTFLSESGTTGSGGSGTTDENGSFVVAHRTGAPGLVAGTYKVIFSKLVLPDGSPMPTNPGTSAATLGARQMMPPDLADASRSRRIVTVAPNAPPLDFDLRVKAVAKR